MTWILGNFKRDFLAFALPGLLGILASFYFQSDTGLLFIVVSFLIKEIIDSGHVYLTFVRTWLSKRARSRNEISLWIPLIVFGGLCLWILLKIPYLWTFFVYATVFHNIRQLYGLQKWYQKLNGRFDRKSDFFLYGVCVLPFCAFHFRDLKLDHYYFSAGDLWFFPQTNVFKFVSTLYFVIILIWILYESQLLRQGKREWNRLTSILLAGSYYGYAFFLGEKLHQIIFPIIASHGVAYAAVVGLSVTRTTRLTFKSVAPLLLGILITFGVYEHLVENETVLYDTPYSQLGPGFGILLAAFFTPLISHYLVDGLIWTQKHPDSGLVFQTKKDPR